MNVAPTRSERKGLKGIALRTGFERVTALTSRGQATIPKEIREGLRMKTGDRMTFTLLPDGTVLMTLKNKSAIFAI
jgi:AbrB family looped-hinge helix DNA binding protein